MNVGLLRIKEFVFTKKPVERNINQHRIRFSWCAATKDVPAMQRMEEYVSNTEQRGILAVRRDVPAMPGSEENVSNTVPRKRLAALKDAPA